MYCSLNIHRDKELSVNLIIDHFTKKGINRRIDFVIEYLLVILLISKFICIFCRLLLLFNKEHIIKYVYN
jgi:hypothetical protein